MTAEIIDLAARRNRRLVRLVREAHHVPDIHPQSLVIPALVLASVALWTACLTIAFTSRIREAPP